MAFVAAKPWWIHGGRFQVPCQGSVEKQGAKQEWSTDTLHWSCLHYRSYNRHMPVQEETWSAIVRSRLGWDASACPLALRWFWHKRAGSHIPTSWDREVLPLAVWARTKPSNLPSNFSSSAQHLSRFAHMRSSPPLPLGMRCNSTLLGLIVCQWKPMTVAGRCIPPTSTCPSTSHLGQNDAGLVETRGVLWGRGSGWKA